MNLRSKIVVGDDDSPNCLNLTRLKSEIVVASNIFRWTFRMGYAARLLFVATCVIATFLYFLRQKILLLHRKAKQVNAQLAFSCVVFEKYPHGPYFFLF